MDSFPSQFPLLSQPPIPSNDNEYNEGNTPLNNILRYPDAISALASEAILPNVDPALTLNDPNLGHPLAQSTSQALQHDSLNPNYQGIPDLDTLLPPFNPLPINSIPGFTDPSVNHTQDSNYCPVERSNPTPIPTPANPQNPTQSVIHDAQQLNNNHEVFERKLPQPPEDHNSASYNTQLPQSNGLTPPVFSAPATPLPEVSDGNTPITPHNPNVNQTSDSGIEPTQTEQSGTSKDAAKTGRKRTRTRTKDMDPSLVHTCPTCGKKFAKKYNQKIHQRRHQGDLPFVCDYENCGKGFMWRSSFLRHLKTHESRPERPRKVMRRSEDTRDVCTSSGNADVMKVPENASIVLLNGVKLDVNHHSLDSITTAVSLCRLGGSACRDLLDINVDVIRDSDENVIASRCQQVNKVSQTAVDTSDPHVAQLQQLIANKQASMPLVT